MKIARDGYLDQIKKFMHNGLVKVITGIRRCGKSYFLFNIFCDYLRGQGVDSRHIIEIRLDEDEFEQLRNPRKLSEYVRARLLLDGRPMYVLIDEIQECRPVDGDRVTFYDVLSTLMKKADVYVTGSNSEMLSEDIATNFRDRGTIIRMWPLSFAEYYQIGGKEKVDAWEDFLVWGGMPLAVLSPDQSSRETYLKNLFKRVYFADRYCRTVFAEERHGSWCRLRCNGECGWRPDQCQADLGHADDDGVFVDLSSDGGPLS